jgi:hypothetical protein
MDATEALTKYLSGVTRYSESLPEYEDYRKSLISPITGGIADSLISMAQNKMLAEGLRAQAMGGRPAVKV